MSARREADAIRILSGVADGFTTGTPIAMVIDNTDQRPAAYDAMARVFRPSHADFTYHMKFGGFRARSGGGRASARETAARVAGGAVAKKLLKQLFGPDCDIVAWVDRVGDVAASVDPVRVTAADVAGEGDIQCPDAQVAPAMTALIDEVRMSRDTIGGVIGVVARGVPPGLGEPVFDKLEADIGKALLSLPAARGVEFGSGFAGVAIRGSLHNDAFVADADGRVSTVTNHSGGIQGGISNGMPIIARVAFKAVATHFHPQDTVDEDGQSVVMQAKGRHDPCVLPRAVVIVEAMVALALADHALRHRAQVGAFSWMLPRGGAGEGS
jgi:chorismate synthase